MFGHVVIAVSSSDGSGRPVLPETREAHKNWAQPISEKNFSKSAWNAI